MRSRPDVFRNQTGDDPPPFGDLDLFALVQKTLDLLERVTKVANGCFLHVIHLSITLWILTSLAKQSSSASREGEDEPYASTLEPKNSPQTSNLAKPSAMVTEERSSHIPISHAVPPSIGALHALSADENFLQKVTLWRAFSRYCWQKARSPTALRIAHLDLAEAEMAWIQILD